MNPFLKTVTTHTIQEATNEHGPGFCLMSVVPGTEDKSGKITSIDLVIGAHYTKRCASAFSKKSVLELAALLAEIGAAMDDPQ